jgi:hypothetical protein
MFTHTRETSKMAELLSVCFDDLDDETGEIPALYQVHHESYALCMYVLMCASMRARGDG